MKHFRAYICALEEGQRKNNIVRIMMIGPENVGKTTLLKILTKQSLPKHERPTQVASGNYPLVELISFDITEMAKTGLRDVANDTVGEAVLHMKMTEVAEPGSTSSSSRYIFDSGLQKRYYEIQRNLNKTESTSSESTSDIEESNNAVSEPKMSIQRHKLYAVFCDFGDQAEYHVTHQPFMSCNSIYVLVFNIAEQLDDVIQRRNNLKSDMTYLSRIQEWLASVHGCQPHHGHDIGNKVITIDGNNYELPIVIMIGSHADHVKAKNEQEKSQKIKEAYKRVAHQFRDKAFSRHIYYSNLAINGNPMDKRRATKQQRHKTCKELCKIFCSIIKIENAFLL